MPPVCTSLPLLPLPPVWAGGGEVDDLIGVEVGAVSWGDEDGDGESLPLARAALSGFDEDEGVAVGYVSACAD